MQIVREKKKAKLQEEQQHLEQIAGSDVELEQNVSFDAQNEQADESAQTDEESVEEKALEDAEKESEQIAEDTQSVD